jgi:NAD-dependent dihydropyrimidine dehydrogenase PreA subunit
MPAYSEVWTEPERGAVTTSTANTGESREPMNEKPQSCADEAGRVVPRIDRNRCEGKAACVTVCPYGVFAVGTLPTHERAGLTLRGKLKGYGHRWQQAMLVAPEACHACGLCVSACPEDAITLVRSA